MRITFVAPFGLGQKTTVWARILPLARHLAAHGHAATLLIPPWDTPVDAGRRWVDDDVQIINVATDGGLPATFTRLLSQLAATKPDIVHIVKPRAYAGLVQWWRWQKRRYQHQKQPRIILDVDDWEQSWATINHYPWPLARFLAWQEEWGIRHADGITAASRWLEDRAQSYAPQTPVLYLPNGIAHPVPQAVARSQDAEAPAILLFTRFTEIEPEWLAAFWCALRDPIPTAHLLIGGQALDERHEYEYRARFATACSAAPQGDPTMSGIKWLGFVPSTSLADLYARVTCAIFPATNNALNLAKCSVKLATTLLHGVPVIASAVGEQANYGANGAARLVPVDATPLAFAGAVVDVVREPAARATLAQHARQHLLARYDWAGLGKELEDFYTRVHLHANV